MARMATLTPQQVRVLMMLSEGLLNKQIAYQLGVSEATVKAHVSAILQKLGVESRTQAVIAAAKIEAGQWPQGAAGGEGECVYPSLPCERRVERSAPRWGRSSRTPHPARRADPPRIRREATERSTPPPPRAARAIAPAARAAPPA